MVLSNYILRFKIGIGDIALPSIPPDVFGYLLLIDRNLYILAYLKEFVISTTIETFFPYYAACIGLFQP